MVALHTKPGQKRRSRSGCSECRQRHRKCDEKKPSCSGCLRTGKECSYTMRLSWGGRSFSKSRFGECLRSDPGLVQVPVCSTGPPAFIYGSTMPSEVTSKPPDVLQEDIQKPTTNDERKEDDIEPSICQSHVLSAAHQTPESDYENIIPNVYQIFRNPYELNWLPKPQRFLLEHFISCTTLSLSCHTAIQDTFCSVIVPMALQTSHLLVAVLSLAATHRVSLGLNQNTAQLDFLKFTSLKQLQTVLSQPGGQLDEAVVATTLTLCTSDIVSGGLSPGSWRSHLQGTAAIIVDHLQGERDSSNPLTVATLLLWRWYLSIESVKLLSGNLVASTSPRTVDQMRQLINSDGFDDHAGFSSSLTPVFNEISLLAIEIDHKPTLLEMPESNNEFPIGEAGYVPNDRIIQRCHRLIEEVQSSLASHEPRFRPTVDASLSSLHKIDFAAVDETYHHVALLQLYRRILNLPSSSALVQTSVQRIIERLSNVHFLDKPCPGVAVLPPLFTAGCEACDDSDRDGIRASLSRYEARYGMGNARSARKFLEDLWIMRDVNGDFEGRVRWDRVMVERGLDIIPY